MSLGVLHTIAQYLRRDRRTYAGTLVFKDGAVAAKFKGAVTAVYNGAGDVTLSLGIRPRLSRVSVGLPQPGANTGACASYVYANTVATDGKVQLYFVRGSDFTTKVDPANDAVVLVEIVTEGEVT